ncbi:ABC transporter ATP-binding protein [Sagittula sp. SSi028]|uniref:ABC transporter ATP-binding protein n=1 Tax=Sagittula sp. SSi028 TaxID=3400636 RepID=UPI003AF69BB2
MTMGLGLRDVVVRSARGRVLLDAPQLDITAGALVGITGPSGAGKTTLLHVLAGLMRSTGQVSWAGQDLAQMSESHRATFRAQHMGMVFQDFLLFDALSAFDNARLSSLFVSKDTRSGIAKEAETLLARFGLQDTGRSVASLSGGERQRVAVARALAANPAVVLADEPTAALDRAAADRLIGDLVSSCRSAGRTLVVVSHDTALLDEMDRVIRVDGGQIVAQETTA